MYFSRQPPLLGERRLRHRHHYINIIIIFIIIIIIIFIIIIALLVIIIVISSGLSGEKGDLEHRQDVFGSNTIPPKPPKTFLEVTPQNNKFRVPICCILYMILFYVYPCVSNHLFSAGVGGLARCHTHHLGGENLLFCNLFF